MLAITEMDAKFNERSQVGVNTYQTLIIPIALIFQCFFVYIYYAVKVNV